MRKRLSRRERPKQSWIPWRFLVALRFLTILPVPGAPPPAEALGQAAGYFPVVGLILGVILLFCAVSLRALMPVEAVAALLIALWVGLTGAMHLDGFVGCCDALLAAARPRQEQPGDAPLGSFGVVGVVTLLLVKYSALCSCPQNLMPYALLAAPTVGRWAMVYAAYLFPHRPGRQGPLEDSFKQSLSLKELLFASLILLIFLSLVVVATTLQLSEPFVVAVVCLTFTVACLAATLLALWVRWRFGGLSGNVYGAINEVAEVAVLLAVIVAQPLNIPGT
jgi:adenosylcobinamide-GDP ribazoletransferase